MRILRRLTLPILLLLGMAPAQPQPAAPPPEPTVVKAIDIDRVPADFPVGFCLMTHGERQYVAYYNAERQMVVASRALDSEQWTYQPLPTRVGWDSHNSITMAFDSEGHLHVSGNMHNVPLIYFRTSRVGDVTSLEKIDSMVGENERRCTYPHFMRDGEGRLVFTYRDGGSGNGINIYNVYDTTTRQWKRLLDRPLLDGQGLMNAYPVGPVRGPDGFFHLGWVWRDTPACETNHDPSYARSRDMIHWETISGKPIELPITIQTEDTIIDPVPAGGGIINGALKFGFDRAGNPLASYHKFDEQGLTQAYVARYEDGRWVPRQVSNWDYRWQFEGGGSMIFDIRLGGPRRHGEGELALSYSHVKHGSGLIIIDEATLAPLRTEAAPPPAFPAELMKVQSDFKGLQVRLAGDSGRSRQRYALRWETLPANRDRKPEGPLPEPSMLRLYQLQAAR